MNDCVQLRSSPATDQALRAALESALVKRIVGLQRRPCIYQSSFALEELTLEFDQGEELSVMFKDIGPHALHEEARSAKPEFLFNPRREIAVYRDLLSRHQLGTANLIAAVEQDDPPRSWLFLEDVEGIELYQTGEIELWQSAARSLRMLHASVPASDVTELPLLKYDAGLYRTWVQRAREFLSESQRSRPAVASRIERIASQYDRVIDRLVALPSTFIHGEFYASNVIVQRRHDATIRVCPVDWELAAIGPGLIDLAALVAGKWSAQKRDEIVRAYSPDVDEADLNCARLHLAVQWLGWSRDWSPPPDHAHEWLTDALHLADQLEL